MFWPPRNKVNTFPWQTPIPHPHPTSGSPMSSKVLTCPATRSVPILFNPPPPPPIFPDPQLKSVNLCSSKFSTFPFCVWVLCWRKWTDLQSLVLFQYHLGLIDYVESELICSQLCYSNTVLSRMNMLKVNWFTVIGVVPIPSWADRLC